MYKVGDIFTEDSEYSKRAQWCNENGYVIVEIEKQGDQRRFQIQEIIKSQSDIYYEELYKLQYWFDDFYDKQLSQALRAQRTKTNWSAIDFDGITYNTISELDSKANEYQLRIRELKEKLGE